MPEKRRETRSKIPESPKTGGKLTGRAIPDGTTGEPQEKPPMMINWRSGFVRLWLGLSIIWIALAMLEVFVLTAGRGFVELMFFSELGWFLMLGPPLALAGLITIVSWIVSWIKSGPSKTNLPTDR